MAVRVCVSNNPVCIDWGYGYPKVGETVLDPMGDPVAGEAGLDVRGLVMDGVLLSPIDGGLVLRGGALAKTAFPSLTCSGPEEA